MKKKEENTDRMYCKPTIIRGDYCSRLSILQQYSRYRRTGSRRQGGHEPRENLSHGNKSWFFLILFFLDIFKIYT